MTLIESLRYEPVELKFGTSGLRGLVSDMTDLECYINTKAFVCFCIEQYPGLSQVYIAGDLRESTPKIVAAIWQAIIDCGLTARYLGLLPTPVLALRAFTESAASVMVTGSHIPADRNGIKYYKPDKELMKYDEQALQEWVVKVRQKTYAEEDSKFNKDGMIINPPRPTVDDLGAVDLYKERLKPIWDDKPLIGMRVAFYQHSTVGRDLLPEIIELCGASVVRFGYSDMFIPVDTENVTTEIREMLQDFLSNSGEVHAIVSADGDADRPLLTDGSGNPITGDMVGLICAEELGVTACAYPVSANDTIDENLKRLGVSYERTKIGSPYVIDAVETIKTTGGKCGWEVNGGFMVGENVYYDDKLLSPLMTRDAMLPILLTLIASKRRVKTIASLFGGITPRRYLASGLVDLPSFEECAKVTAKLIDSGTDLSEVFKGFGKVINLNLLDGVRITFDSGDIAHIRGSGNAPQLRIYATANTQERANEIVQLCIKKDGKFEQLSAS